MKTNVARVGWGAGLETLVQAEETAGIRMLSQPRRGRPAGRASRLEWRGWGGAGGEDVGPAVATPHRGLSPCSGVPVPL